MESYALYVVMSRDDEKMVHKRWDVKECSARDFCFSFCANILQTLRSYIFLILCKTVNK